MGKNILILAEHNNGTVRKTAFEMITAARSLTPDSVLVFLAGENLDALTSQFSGSGADTLLLAENASLNKYSLSAEAKLVQEIIESKNIDVVLTAAGSHGKELLPTIAAKTASAFAADCVHIEADGDAIIAKRPIYAGKALIDIKLEGLACISMRPNAVTPEKADGEPAIEKLNTDSLDLSLQLTDLMKKDSARPELTEASMIVSGGRGMGGSEHYPVIEELADLLGAAVGASRAAVDAGWRPHSDQVGQTGKTVSPNLYIACGISGAIQHLAGMSSSKVIVAINKDEEAPIFKVADYGIVGDLFEVVPAIVSGLKK